MNTLDILRRWGILEDVKAAGANAFVRRAIEEEARFRSKVIDLAFSIRCVSGIQASREALEQFAHYVASRTALTREDVVDLVKSRLLRMGSLDAAVLLLRDLASG